MTLVWLLLAGGIHMTKEPTIILLEEEQEFQYNVSIRHMGGVRPGERTKNKFLEELRCCARNFGFS